MELSLIQSALREQGLDGWLFYDHHRRDPIAYRVLKINPPMCTRRWYYLIPAEGEPRKLIHRVERQNLAGLPGTELPYSSWKEQHEGLKKILQGKSRLAMQYSALNDIPGVGLVDAGTIELVKSFGVEVVSSADLVQLFEARWGDDALASHLEAGEVVHAAVQAGFAAIGEAVRAGKGITECGVQQAMQRVFAAGGVVTDEGPVAAVNRNTANPHYMPGREGSLPIGASDFVLLDVWGKMDRPGAVYFDVTWTGFVGREVPRSYTEVFEVVREARDGAVEFVQAAVQSGRTIHGYEVDDVARRIITRRGYGEYFVHRTGHSIGEEVHGNGANIDNFETRDTRRIIPRTCFSIEPGIYLPEFGVRSEVNVFIGESSAQVTGEIQSAIVPILAPAC
jgi:Xaa-Pro aminopeptidase